MMKACRAALLSLVMVMCALNASATERDDELIVAADLAPDRPQVAFDRSWAIGQYASGWMGSYGAVGVGTRIRWEFMPGWLGVQVFGESALVDPGADVLRHDHQVGFDLYMPFRLSDRWQLRPMLGFCSVLSFIEPTVEDGPRNDDVLFGIHTGLGVEVSLNSWLSLFLDAQVYGYTGHDRDSAGWTANVSEDLTLSALFQTNFGVQIHLGP